MSARLPGSPRVTARSSRPLTPSGQDDDQEVSQTEGIVQWLSEYSPFAENEIVNEMRGVKVHTAQRPVDLLLEWMHLIDSISSLVRTDERAAPIARNKKITQVAIGVFLGGWGSEAIANALNSAKHLVTLEGQGRKEEAMTELHKHQKLGFRGLVRALKKLIDSPGAPASGRRVGQ